MLLTASKLTGVRTFFVAVCGRPQGAALTELQLFFPALASSGAAAAAPESLIKMLLDAGRGRYDHRKYYYIIIFYNYLLLLYIIIILFGCILACLLGQEYLTSKGCPQTVMQVDHFVSTQHSSVERITGTMRAFVARHPSINACVCICFVACRRGNDAGAAAQRCVAQCVAVLVVRQGAGQVQASVKELLAMLKADTSERVAGCVGGGVCANAGGGFDDAGDVTQLLVMLRADTSE